MIEFYYECYALLISLHGLSSNENEKLKKKLFRLQRTVCDKDRNAQWSCCSILSTDAEVLLPCRSKPVLKSGSTVILRDSLAYWTVQ